MRFIFCIIGVLLYSGLSAQQMSVLSTDSTYNIVRELQEVVVTAEKRELNPGDIPTALTVITPRSIPAAGRHPQSAGWIIESPGSHLYIEQ